MKLRQLDQDNTHVCAIIYKVENKNVDKKRKEQEQPNSNLVLNIVFEKSER